MKSLVIGLAFLCVWSCGGNSWDAAVERANAKQQPLIVEFYATWCGPCKKFEREVLTDSVVVRELKTVELVRYDFDSTAGAHHAKRLGVRGVPSVVAVGRDGEAIGRLVGAVPKATFLEFLGWAREQ